MTPAYIPPIAALTSQNSAETLVGSRSSIEKGFPPEKCDASWFLASPTPSEIDSEIKWRRGPGFWRCFIAVCIPILLSAFEGSVVSTALPTISSALGIGSNSSWVATAFLLASIVFQPLYGQLADIWGRRHLMMFAVVIFCVGSIICGVTKSGAVLIFGRIVQGIGSGGIDLFAELILCDIIPLSKRGHYVAIKAAVYALGTTVGPLLGGVFAQGPPQMWRWCFYINIPVSIVALVMMMFWLRVTNGSGFVECSLKDKLKQVDYTGILLLTMAVVLFLFAMTTGGTVHPWLSPAIFVPLGIAVIELTAFVFWERSRWCTHPIMSPHVFSNRTTIAAFVITVLHGFITYAFQFYLPPFFQSVLGASPAQSGELILPCTLSIVIFASLGGPVLAKFGRYRLMHQVGFFLMIAGLTPCIFVNSSAKGLWILFSLLVGIGSGIIVSTTLPTVLVELTDKDNAAATGSWAFLRGLGSLLGVAIPNAVFNAQFELGLELVDDTAVRAQFGKGLAYEHASAAFISKLSPEIKNTIIDTFRESFKLVWGVFFAFAVFGFFVTWMENQVSLRKELDSDYGLEKKTKNVEKIIV
ncbi:major facilitator superfamily domain-containing protein [Podospora fimiseda]|uniref:Major facilitator superfamily domain-containing protein n=1 Tax=Podospora fimiseda TaxID=252190 RepID=A0AAN7BIG0_9PEZI|nr:major facilitator superfamily domain-containing protein [Podospora fimiseda]